MPLDKVLIKHLDEQDALEENIEADIEKLISDIDVSVLIHDPEMILMEIVEAVQDILKEEYYAMAAKNGVRLAEDIEEDGDIQIPKSDNPNLNEGGFDGAKR